MTKSPAVPSYHRDIEGLRRIARGALTEASRQGASAASAAIGAAAGLSASVRLGDVETIEHHLNKGLTVTVYFGQKRGWATTSDFASQAIDDTVSAACRIARFTSEDDCAGLAEPELLAKEFPELSLYHPWSLTPQRATELALEAENAARDFDKRISNSEGAEVTHVESSHIFASTDGFCAGYASTRHSIRCAVIAQSEAGMQRDDWYSVSRDPDTLEDPASIGRRAAERAVNRLDAKQLKTQTVPVIFCADVATSILGHFISAVSGGSLYRKSSFLLDHLGKQVFPTHVEIREEPHIQAALGSAPFDGEGVATHARHLVRDGVLEGYVLSSYSARKLGMQTTGNAGGVHNLIVTPGTQDLAGLMQTMQKGLLVTELMGMGVNKVTGDYSRGATGFWVEQGEIQYPVEEITIAGNLRDIFLGIQEVGADVDERSTIRTGSLLVDQMTVAGE